MSVTVRKAAGTSFWKKLTMPGTCSSATSVKTLGGLLRFWRADSRTRSASFSRAIADRRRSAAGAKFRLMMVKIALEMPEE